MQRASEKLQFEASLVYQWRNQILNTSYLDNAGINEFEHIRESFRDLMKYIPHDVVIYDTNFDDEILSVDWNESELENDDLKNYKAKAEYYVR